jgi:Undecaprenyl-phosphate galactose phosphotransferase WbaP
VAAVLGEDDAGPLPEACGEMELIRVRATDHAAARAAIGDLAARYPGVFALVSLDDADTENRQRWLDIIDLCFRKTVLIPDIFTGARVWVMAVAIGRLSGVLLKQNLLDTRRMALKRIIELALTAACGVFLLLALLGFTIAIRLDSRGPAFFRQQRIGRGGRRFRIYQFRTLVLDAPERLEAYLAAHPETRAEWEADQKLKDDPRVTRVGHFLRKTSLDELPQVLNVLRGEMSLVGPRPIVAEEIEKYGDGFDLYSRVRPGMTGLWQISGRNNISYASRVWLDKHYVCNWSVWMDVLILARTIPVVLRGTGAY